VSIEVGRESSKSDKRGYVKPNYKDRKDRIVNPRNIKQRDPMVIRRLLLIWGLNNLFAVVISDGSALLAKGRKIESEYYWWKERLRLECRSVHTRVHLRMHFVHECNRYSCTKLHAYSKLQHYAQQKPVSYMRTLYTDHYS
jgi:hypothetical protein